MCAGEYYVAIKIILLKLLIVLADDVLGAIPTKKLMFYIDFILLFLFELIFVRYYVHSRSAPPSRIILFLVSPIILGPS